MKKIFSLVICGVLLLGITGCGNEKKLAEKAVAYLENLEDYNYKCNKESKYEAVGNTYKGNLYVCSSKNVTTERTFIISYDDEFSLDYIFEEKFSDETINYILYSNAFTSENVGRIWLYRNNEQFVSFEHTEFSDNKDVSIPEYCVADYYPESMKNSETCEYAKSYQHLVNESIKEYKNVYRELGLEMPIQ